MVRVHADCHVEILAIFISIPAELDVCRSRRLDRHQCTQSSPELPEPSQVKKF